MKIVVIGVDRIRLINIEVILKTNCMKRFLSLFAIATLVISSTLLYAQQNNVGIGTTTPNPNAVLEIVSPNNNQGVLVPRLSQVQRDAIVPLTVNEAGLLIYNIDDNLFNYWNGTTWIPFPGSASTDLDSQLITFSYIFEDSIRLSISKGNTITFSISDADADSMNELQNLDTLSGNIGFVISGTEDTIFFPAGLTGTDEQDLSGTSTTDSATINITNGSSVTFSIQDADADSMNELQNLDTLAGNTGFVISGTEDTIFFPSGVTDTDEQDLSGTSTTDSATIDITNGSGVTFSIQDADADSMNELQNLDTLAGNTGFVISGTEDTIFFPSGVTDTDEQDLSGTSTTDSATINITNGSSVTFSIQDADADSTNELQGLDTLLGNTGFVISGTNDTIFFPSGVTDTDEQDLSGTSTTDSATIDITNGSSVTFSIKDADADSTNELQGLDTLLGNTGFVISGTNDTIFFPSGVTDTDEQDLSGTSTTDSATIDITNGSSVTFSIKDADADSTNELQGLDTLLGNTGFVISGTNDTIFFPSGVTDTDEQDLSGTSTTDSATIDITNGSSVTFSIKDADADSTNELQGLDTLLGNTGFVISGTNDTIFFPSGVTDTDEQDLSGTSTTDSATIDITNGSSVTFSIKDADADSTNELQGLDTLLGNTGFVISGTNDTIFFPSGVTDTDEQDLSGTSTTDSATIDITNGSSVTFSIKDADADSTNELQGLDTLLGNTGFVISGTNDTIFFPSGVTDTDEQDLSGTSTTDSATIDITNGSSVTFSIKDADADSTNELQGLDTLLGNTGFVISGTEDTIFFPPGTVDTDEQDLSGTSTTDSATIDITNGASVTFSIKDADADSTNELQSLLRLNDTTYVLSGTNDTLRIMLGVDLDEQNLSTTIISPDSIQIGISNGNSVTISIADSDADSLNEIQSLIQINDTSFAISGSGDTISVVANTDNQDLGRTLVGGDSVQLDITGGESVTISIADSDADSLNEIQSLIQINDTSFAISGSGDTISVVANTDNQDLGRTLVAGDSVQLDITGGESVTISIADSDADSLNEIQSLIQINDTSFAISGSGDTISVLSNTDNQDLGRTLVGGDSVQLDITGGESVTISIADSDADSLNEIQSLIQINDTSFAISGSGDTISVVANTDNQDLGRTLVGGDSVQLDITGGESVTISIADSDADSLNEIQSLIQINDTSFAISGSGDTISVVANTDNQDLGRTLVGGDSVQLDITGGESVTISIADSDADSLNEIQSLIQINDTSFAISGSGDTISVLSNTDNQDLGRTLVGGDSVQLDITGGESVTISIADSDADSLNEIQSLIQINDTSFAISGSGDTISVVANTDNQDLGRTLVGGDSVQLDITGGESVTISIADSDADSLNEIQSLIQINDTSFAISGSGDTISVVANTDNQDLGRTLVGGDSVQLDITGGESVTISIADSDADSLNEIQSLIQINDTSFAISGSGDTISVVANTDNQDLGRTLVGGDSVQLDITGGESVTISIADSDADSLNEIQSLIQINDTSFAISGSGDTISVVANTDNQDLGRTLLAGDSVQLDITGGESVTISIADSDADSLNEIQSLIQINDTSFAISGSGDTISVVANTDNQDLGRTLVGGDSVQLDITGGESVTISIADSDADSLNEIQSLIQINDTSFAISGSGDTISVLSNTDNQDLGRTLVGGDSVQLDITGGESVTISIADSDADSLNEIQSLIQINDTSFAISGSGDTISVVANTDNQDLGRTLVAGDSVQLDITGGESVTISIADSDADSLNEIQSLIQINDTSFAISGSGDTISVVANTDNQDLGRTLVGGDSVQLDITGGESVTISIADSDADSLNEIQSLIQINDTSFAISGSGDTISVLSNTDNQDLGRTLVGGDSVQLDITGGESVTISIADSDADSLNEIQSLIQINDTSFAISGSGDTISVVANTDNQDLGRTLVGGDSVQLDITGGESVTISIADSDADSLNEIQSLIQINDTSFAISGSGDTISVLSNTDNQDLGRTLVGGDSVQLDITGGESVTISIADSDADSLNEIQSLIQINDTSFAISGSGDTISVVANTDNQDLGRTLVGGDSVQLDITGGESVTISIADSDADSTNEIQSLIQINDTSFAISGSGDTISVVANTDNQDLGRTLVGGDSVQLDITGGESVTISIADSDADSLNEIQSLIQINDTSFAISGSGDTISVLSNTDNQDLGRTLVGGDSVQLDITGGESVTISIADSDADSLNEIQSLIQINDTSFAISGSGDTISVVANTDNQDLGRTLVGGDSVQLDITGGESVTISIADSDADSLNEIQSLIQINDTSFVITETNDTIRILAGSSITANNGLNLTGSQVRLGGTLIQNTQITTTTNNNLVITDDDSPADQPSLYIRKATPATDFSDVRVGINTNAPRGAFHVAEDMIVGGSGVDKEDGNSEHIEFEAKNTTGAGSTSSIYVGLSNQAASNQKFFIGKSQTQGNDDRRLFEMNYQTGRIGLNLGEKYTESSNPTTRLHIVAESGEDPLRLEGLQAANDDSLLSIDDNGIVHKIAVSDVADDGDWTISGNDIFNANSGNVGIGKSSPAQKLEVAGNVRIDGGNRSLITEDNFTLNSGSALDIAGTTGVDIIIDSDNSGTGSEFNIKSNGAADANTLVRVLENGRVGIGTGTTNPDNQLHVIAATDPLKLEGIQAATDDSVLTIDSDGVVHKRVYSAGGGSVTAANNGLTLNGSTVELGGALNKATKVTLGTHNMKFELTNAGNFQVGFAAGNPSIYVDPASGRVGINTSSVANELQVEGSMGFTGNARNIIAGDDFDIRGSSSVNIKLDHNEDGANDQFNVLSGSGGIDTLFTVLDDNGNVGINDNTPDHKLDIHHTGSANNAHVNLTQTGAGNPSRLQFDNSNISNRRWSVEGTTNSTTRNALFKISFDTTAAGAGNDIIYTSGDGKVGINAAPITHAFEVTGDAGKTTGGAVWNTVSDKRLKEDIKPYEQGLDFVLKLNPKWFTYNGLAGIPKSTEVGLIAQDLQDLAPYMISEWTYKDPITGMQKNYLSVNYGALTFALVNSIQQQQQKIETDGDRINKLEAEVEALKKIINDLVNTKK